MASQTLLHLLQETRRGRGAGTLAHKAERGIDEEQGGERLLTASEEVEGSVGRKVEDDGWMARGRWRRDECVTAESTGAVFSLSISPSLSVLSSFLSLLFSLFLCSCCCATSPLFRHAGSFFSRRSPCGSLPIAPRALGSRGCCVIRCVW